VITGMITVGILGVFMYFACPMVIGLMTPDPAVRSLGVQVLRIIILFEPVYAVSLISSGSFQGAGDTLVPEPDESVQPVGGAFASDHLSPPAVTA